MTPKEKAQELVYRFCAYSDGASLQLIKTIKGNAKQCALIAVDEIIEQESKHDPSINDVRYWEDVKKEIINYESF